MDETIVTRVDTHWFVIVDGCHICIQNLVGLSVQVDMMFIVV